MTMVSCTPRARGSKLFIIYISRSRVCCVDLIWLLIYKAAHKTVLMDSCCLHVLACMSYIQAWWCIYAGVNWVSIGSDNGLVPNRHQAIIWINVDLLSFIPVRTKLHEIWIWWYNFLPRNCIWKCCLQDVSHFAQASMCSPLCPIYIYIYRFDNIHCKCELPSFPLPTQNSQ